jgi:hypothetical protein
VRTIPLAASFLLAALYLSPTYAGDPLIALNVSIGAFHSETDIFGGFGVSAFNAGKYDVILTGNPVRPYLNRDGGQHISLKIDGKRYPVKCSPVGCKAKAVPVGPRSKGIVTLASR